jgi:hypothetical protein
MVLCEGGAGPARLLEDLAAGRYHVLVLGEPSRGTGNSLGGSTWWINLLDT